MAGGLQTSLYATVALTWKDGGDEVATEIVGMRIFGVHSEKQPVAQVLKAAGRDLPERVRFRRQA